MHERLFLPEFVCTRDCLPESLFCTRECLHEFVCKRATAKRGVVKLWCAVWFLLRRSNMFIALNSNIYPAPSGAECTNRAHCAPLERQRLACRNYKHRAPLEHSRLLGDTRDSSGALATSRGTLATPLEHSRLLGDTRDSSGALDFSGDTRDSSGALDFSGTLATPLEHSRLLGDTRDSSGSTHHRLNKCDNLRKLVTAFCLAWMNPAFSLTVASERCSRLLCARGVRFLSERYASRPR